MRALFFTLVFAILLGGGLAFLWLYYGGFEGEQEKVIAFIDVYGEYTQIAEGVESLVYLPGVEHNSDRRELLALLNSILTESMEPERREELSRLAFTNLDVLKKEVDSAQAVQAKLYQVLQDLDNASREFESIELSKRTDEIVSIARKRAETSARITSILSETNEHTYSIITRIIADKGNLSSEHIGEINTATFEAEKRFSTLEDLYRELQAQRKTIDEKFTSFTKVAL